MVSSSIQSVNIRPEVSILSILKSVNYKAWYAVAEFVDNAIQSAITKYGDLVRIEGEDYRLRISIEIDATPGEEKVTIRDNAGGIGIADFPRAFRPASLPVDRDGLSEFGMGMKSAACWFADHWTVRTTALDEPVERTVTFDVQRIVDQQIENVPIRERSAPERAHYTEITLTRLNQIPQKKTVSKIKSHLSSMYRVFLREGFIEITYNNEPVTFSDPDVLVAPFYKTPDETPIEWKKPIEIQIAAGMRIYGFAALRKVADTTGKAGFALLRRNRVIMGSDDEGYRPREIFGQPGSFASQRVFGELHLEGFSVSHTKDGIQWNYREDEILQLLKEALNDSPIQLLTQAREYRARVKTDPSKGQQPKSGSSQPNSPPPARPPFVPSGLSSGSSSISSSDSAFSPAQIPVSPQPTIDNTDSTEPTLLTPLNQKNRIFKVALNNEIWTVRVELSTEEGIGDWWSIQELGELEIDIRVALAHPFTTEFCQLDEACLEPLTRLAASMAVAERGAQNVGIQKPATFRRFINQVLRDGFLDD